MRVPLRCVVRSLPLTAVYLTYSQTSPEVNIAYLDNKTGDWVSISGKASINTDKTKVKKHWHGALKAWFDDKKDGTHTGDEHDPRVAMIDVTPTVRATVD